MTISRIWYDNGYNDAYFSGNTVPSWGQIGSVPGCRLKHYTDGWRDGRRERQIEDQKKVVDSVRVISDAAMRTKERQERDKSDVN